MRIDAHQHFWRFDPAEYGWIDESMSILQRDYLPQDIERHLARSNIEGTIAVQARQSMEENHFLLDLALKNDLIRGVVGWVDLCSSRVTEDLIRIGQDPLLKGVRYDVQDEPDDDFMTRSDFMRGISHLREFDLTYDILIRPRQLPAARRLVDEFPEQAFVLDHLGKPDIRSAAIEPWSEEVRALAEHSNLHCKLSGMVTEAAWDDWKREELFPFIDVVFDAFGPDRVMYGSDWPVCLLAANYSGTLDVVEEYAKGLSLTQRSKLMGSNAAGFYKL